MKQYYQTNNIQTIPETASTSFKYFQRELLILSGLLLFFWLFNLAIYSRFPIVWMDEAAYTDPSANLYLGNGFTSSMWYAQTKDEFWAGNVPLHQFLLYGWMRLFGFSLLTVRSFNYVIITAAVMVLWLAVIRLNLVSSGWSRVSLIFIVLFGYGVSLNYRSGRPDSITIFLAAAALFAFSIRSTRLRCILLLCLGALFPIAGLQLLPYTVIICFLLFIFLGKSSLKESVSLITGIILGVAFLYILYQANGVWDGFIASILPHTSADAKSSSNVIASFLKKLTGPNFSRDPSLPILFISGVALTIYQAKNGSFRLRSPLGFGVTSSILVPLVMFVAGKFATYYSWMALIPLAIGICSALSSIKFNWKNSLHSLAISFIIFACLIGFPFQAAVAFSDWGARDHEVVESLVAKNVKSSDWVYCDFAAYFAVKTKAEIAFSPFYLGLLTPEEKSKISVLIIDPNRLQEITEQVGGKWSSSSEEIKSSKKKNGVNSTILFNTYHLQIFRRNGAV